MVSKWTKKLVKRNKIPRIEKQVWIDIESPEKRRKRNRSTKRLKSRKKPQKSKEAKFKRRRDNWLKCKTSKAKKKNCHIPDNVSSCQCHLSFGCLWLFTSVFVLQSDVSIGMLVSFCLTKLESGKKSVEFFLRWSIMVSSLRPLKWY